GVPRTRHSFPTRRSSDLNRRELRDQEDVLSVGRRSRRSGRRLAQTSVTPRSVTSMFGRSKTELVPVGRKSRSVVRPPDEGDALRSEEHTSELQSRENLVC